MNLKYIISTFILTLSLYSASLSARNPIIDPVADTLTFCTHNDVVWREGGAFNPCPTEEHQLSGADLAAIRHHHATGRLLAPFPGPNIFNIGIIIAKLIHDAEDCILGEGELL